MKRVLLLFVMIITLTGSVFANQFGVYTFSIQRGTYIIKGKVVVDHGYVKYTYSEDGSIEHTLTYRCNANVSPECIYAVFQGIESTISIFWHLNKVSANDQSYITIKHVKDAINECEDAISYYEKGGCKSRVEGLQALLKELNMFVHVATTQPISQGDLYKINWVIMHDFSYLDTYKVCGYVY